MQNQEKETKRTPQFVQENVANAIRQRTVMLSKCKDNPELQAIEIAICKKDILYWFRNYMYTDKNAKLFDNTYPSVVPFIPFPFQEEAILEMRESIQE